jgi:starch-binding outer membrane protein, SusD/RagB family
MIAMKKFIYILLFFVGFSGCESFLETEDLLNKNDLNFPLTEDDLQASLAAIYQPMAREQWGVFYNGAICSDEVFGGGGPNDFKVAAIDKHLKDNENMLSSTWANYYTGIFRANKLFENFDNVQEVSTETGNQVLGEAHFMRAWYYFSLVRLFGEVPLFTVAENVVKPKGSAQEIYGQIASDLKSAIELFPSTSFTSMPPSHLGHANKWAAEALMARVFLFYTGYYEATDLPLAEEGSISKNQVITWLEDCIDNSGHQLAEDFRELWPYTNPLTVEDYVYTAGQDLEWLGESGDNPETVFAVKFGNDGGWGNSYRNQIVTNFSIRWQSDYANVFPFGSGWGQGTVNTRLIDQWEQDEPGDPRIQMSVLNVDDPSEGIAKYEDNGWTQVHDTHHFNKKYTGITVWKNKDDSTIYKSYTAPLYGAAESNWIRESQDLVLIRYADVLLMHSELTETADGINLVRARVGLAPIAYSFEALQKERRHELSFEGVRYYDLLRWYGKSAGAILDANQNGVPVINSNVEGTMSFNLTERMNATGGFWPIPETELTLSNGELKQNAGWEGSTGSL